MTGRVAVIDDRRAWRPFLGVSITYAVGRILADAIMQGVAGPSAAIDPTAEVASAVVVGGTLTLLTTMVSGTARSRIAALTIVLFASVAAVMIEGSAFAPELSPAGLLPLGLSLQLGVSLMTASAAVRLSPQHPADSIRQGLRVLPTVLRVAAAATAYVVTYFITGAINYVLVTGPYYATHAGGLTAPAPAIVLVVALLEGVLLTLGTVPLALALRGSPRARALACGVALWLLGGLVPLLQEPGLPDVVRLASAFEILFQKLPLGIVIVGLFAPGRSRSGASSRVMTTDPRRQEVRS